MTISEYGLMFIRKWEGFRAKPYIDSSGMATIGYGFTFYPNGTKVTMQDKPISQREGIRIFKIIVKNYEKAVNKLIKVPISQNQFDALVSLCYNIGVGNFQKSALVSLVNKNPNSPEIANEFQKFVFANGKKLQGLVNRRADEARLYFEKTKKKVPMLIIATLVGLAGYFIYKRNKERRTK
ncbi:lysozyme [Capnocytophaga catalasegens]|uniref:Lysozyme n=1 Tax=Capnocytophaga catalasegens TaxID=1004260 RepID=A0AAV5B0P7_9FLAO|nr:lysozyme [Capnocytophaga catalasegens]GIZ16625.1 lysozyme [Capnocytophaga catalasegens]GJM51273.1 lysozyme [Capnocytophaga catalasegens]GJM54000.1 lysozyme [Capnocytophaga catalasegens]